MPQILTLNAVPNQTFTTTLDGDRYVISIYMTSGGMSCDITRNEEIVITGTRIVGGTFILPYAYCQNLSGNFILVTQNYELPDYTEFQSTQTFVYMSLAEMAAAANS